MTMRHGTLARKNLTADETVAAVRKCVELKKQTGWKIRELTIEIERLDGVLRGYETELREMLSTDPASVVVCVEDK